MSQTAGNKQKVIIVEGNIGAGKSTFLQMISRYLAVQIVPEPLSHWQRPVEGRNLLDMFYQDQQRWGYTFETYAFLTRVMEQERMAASNIYPIQVLERSVFSDRYCFTKNLYEQGMITALEWHMYQEWFTWLVDSYVTKPDGFIYLKTDPETCYRRMQKRNRSEEEAVPLAYLRSLHDKHEQMLCAKEGVSSYLKETPVLILECDREFESDEDEQQAHIEAIMKFCDESVAQPIDYSYESAVSL